MYIQIIWYIIIYKGLTIFSFLMFFENLYIVIAFNTSYVRFWSKRRLVRKKLSCEYLLSLKRLIDYESFSIRYPWKMNSWTIWVQKSVLTKITRKSFSFATTICFIALRNYQRIWMLLIENYELLSSCNMESNMTLHIILDHFY